MFVLKTEQSQCTHKFLSNNTPIPLYRPLLRTHLILFDQTHHTCNAENRNWIARIMFRLKWNKIGENGRLDIDRRSNMKRVRSTFDTQLNGFIVVMLWLFVHFRAFRLSMRLCKLPRKIGKANNGKRKQTDWFGFNILPLRAMPQAETKSKNNKQYRAKEQRENTRPVHSHSVTADNSRCIPALSSLDGWVRSHSRSICSER